VPRAPRAIDITGQRFGLLVVQRREGTHPSTGEAMWLCLCDCGQEIRRKSASLRLRKPGVVQSCGCRPPVPLIDIAGRRFGAWTALERAANVGHLTYWKCRCDCGTERPVCAQSLLRGASKSCGCQGPTGKPYTARPGSRTRRNHRVPDLAGQKFGKLAVVRLMREGKGGRAVWWCRCSCGGSGGNPGYARAMTHNLRSGNTVSCGCEQRKRSKGRQAAPPGEA